ncbi:MAG: hypothetical protein LC732_05815 [Acidobacteria bacterium]|nr:hypothetical protein [Acidobacteriota bacterium]
MVSQSWKALATFQPRPESRGHRDFSCTLPAFSRVMDISLAPEAAVHLRAQADGRLLRISFTTGCGGSGYRLAWSDEPLEDDTVFDLDAVRVALDSMATSKLDGAVIVYDAVEDGFIIDHPDAAVAVWCG